MVFRKSLMLSLLLVFMTALLSISTSAQTGDPIPAILLTDVNSGETQHLLVGQKVKIHRFSARPLTGLLDGIDKGNLIINTTFGNAFIPLHDLSKIEAYANFGQLRGARTLKVSGVVASIVGANIWMFAAVMAVGGPVSAGLVAAGPITMVVGAIVFAIGQALKSKTYRMSRWEVSH